MSGIFILLSLVLMGFVVFTIGFYYSFYALLIIIGIFASIPLLNHLGKTSFSRTLLCLSVPLLTMVFSVITKITTTPHVADFFDVRILILAASVIPPIIFPIEERRIMSVILVIDFLLLALFDPIHTYFGVGYIQGGFQPNHYYLITVVTLIAFLFQILSILTLKKNVRLRYAEKERLLERMNQQNKTLIESNIAIESQKQELESAKNLIEKQSKELANKNEELEIAINEKARNLIETNNELVQYNNELRQFSYTVSHNLRAPVASLIGLTNIMDSTNLNDDNKLIIEHIKSSSKKLDSVFKDLNKIIDLRNSIGGVKEKIYLKDEVRAVKNVLKNEIAISKAIIESTFEVPIVYSIRPFLNSILYNLISNAIKYKTKLRKPIVKIHSSQDKDKIKISVSDNGMGIDTHAYKEDIFKMYKRFHQHTEGKGLGLYLVKLQADSLGGSIEVQSKVNEGSTFTLTLEQSDNVEDQTVMEKEFYRVFYDAYSNTTGIIWKRNVTDEEYREAFTRNLEIFRQFKTPHWISSMNGIEPASPENQQWLINSVIPDAIEYGLEKLAVVAGQELSPEYRTYIEKVIEKLRPHVLCELFTTIDKAKSWINEEETT